MFVDMVPVTDVFTTNSYFYIDETTRHGFLIDPGAEPQRLKQIIKDKNYVIEKILLTHGHFDHTGGVEVLARELSVSYYIHENGEKFLEDVHYNLSIHCKKFWQENYLFHIISTKTAKNFWKMFTITFQYIVIAGLF